MEALFAPRPVAANLCSFALFYGIFLLFGVVLRKSALILLSGGHSLALTSVTFPQVGPQKATPNFNKASTAALRFFFFPLQASEEFGDVCLGFSPSTDYYSGRG